MIGGEGRGGGGRSGGGGAGMGWDGGTMDLVSETLEVKVPVGHPGGDVRQLVG